MEINDSLTVNCPDCLESIATTIGALEEDNYLICPECMSEVIVDTDSLLLKRESIFRMAQEHLDAEYGFDDDSKEDRNFKS